MLQPVLTNSSCSGWQWRSVSSSQFRPYLRRFLRGMRRRAPPSPLETGLMLDLLPVPAVALTFERGKFSSLRSIAVPHGGLWHRRQRIAADPPARQPAAPLPRIGRDRMTRSRGSSARKSIAAISACCSPRRAAHRGEPALPRHSGRPDLGASHRTQPAPRNGDRQPHRPAEPRRVQRRGSKARDLRRQ